MVKQNFILKNLSRIHVKSVGLKKISVVSMLINTSRIKSAAVRKFQFTLFVFMIVIPVIDIYGCFEKVVSLTDFSELNELEYLVIYFVIAGEAALTFCKYFTGSAVILKTGSLAYTYIWGGLAFRAKSIRIQTEILKAIQEANKRAAEALKAGWLGSIFGYGGGTLNLLKI